jgi:mono/diheme cytochrome c family protein
MTRAGLTLLLWASASAAAWGGSTELRFVRDGAEVGRTDLPALRRACKAVTITLDDPYYGRRKSFRAFALKDVLALGFREPVSALRREEFSLQALDGYLKPASGERLVEDGGYVAFADAELTKGETPAWEPIDRKQVDPAPYYMVWSKPGQVDDEGYPWPYQLAAIEIVSFEKKFPLALPTSARAESPAWRGFRVFRTQCISCHSINGQGGRIGPDLNVPQSIVEYRPVDQIKAYIRNPETFRYSSMPAHPGLGDADLDDLVAYFETMKKLKHDPGKKP